ncbi:MAG TPA: phosphotransferase [Mycobacteriales bacterium]|nr:phosphotransferase [Mycobacteriales bacterium]
MTSRRPARSNANQAKLPSDALDWLHRHVQATSPVEVTRQRPWSTVARTTDADGVVWFKACAPVQAFEPRLTAGLSDRWPDRVPEVIAWNENDAWMLLRDAGVLLRQHGNPPEVWLQVLPRYSELQRGEAARVAEHLAVGVPDLRVETLPAKLPELLQHELPFDSGAAAKVERFASTFAGWCEELAAHGIPASIQHDDLHHGNVYLDDGRTRVLDWGDSSISHPFASAVVTFRFLEQINGLPPDDPWFARLRDAYLEPWGSGLTEVFDLAVRVGRFAHAIAWIKQRQAVPVAERATFDEEYARVLRRAVAVIP